MLQFNLIGASSLDNLKVRLGLSDDEENQIMSEPGMAFTRNVPNCPEKSLIYSLKNAQFKNDKPIIIWHDAINNSLSNFKKVRL